MRHLSILLIAYVVAACSKSESTRRPAPAEVEQSPSVAPTASAAPPPPASAPDAAASEVTATAADAGLVTTPAPAAGAWTHFSTKNQVPLCLFATYEQYEKTPLLKNVKKTVNLRAHVPAVFGIYAPGCAALNCIQYPTMQCWAEVQDHDIKIETRYSGEQNTVAKCTKDCESVTAACDTPNLLPGTYTVHYAEKTVQLKIPGSHKPACITP